MTGTFRIDSDSFWVVAPEEDTAGNPGSRVLSDAAGVATTGTSEGPAVRLFTDVDMAERFIAATNADGFVPATFLDLLALMQFLIEVDAMGVKHGTIDSAAGHDGEGCTVVALAEIARSIRDEDAKGAEA